ncbi:MAG: A/G-specific adenine glycosylase [Bryobacteraceae bacterium]
MPSAAHVRRQLTEWYDSAHRKLPWRETRDPYRIWLSEIMLQQTRVAAVLPYYEKFLRLFPDVQALAEAPEADLLAAWSGLGYYSRARNLQKAARQILARGAFPDTYESIRELAGVGDYTAAAVASLAFGLPHAVLDGNVLRVLSRWTGEKGDIQSTATRKRLRQEAGRLLDSRNPGRFNQAMMELGALICLPRGPKCQECPIARSCEARKLGLQHQLPVKLRRTAPVSIERTLLIVERNGRLLLWQRAAGASRMAGFWELPEREQLPEAEPIALLGSFRHSITHHNYTFTVQAARTTAKPAGFRWLSRERIASLPLSTTAKKALQLSHSRVNIC